MKLEAAKQADSPVTAPLEKVWGLGARVQPVPTSSSQVIAGGSEAKATSRIAAKQAQPVVDTARRLGFVQD